MVKTGHPGAGAHVGARRAPACAGTEARGWREGLRSRGGGVQSPTALRACLCPWSPAVLAERKTACDGRSRGHVRRGRAIG